MISGVFDIGRWSFARVALVSALWVVVNIVLIAAAIYIWFRWETRGTGSGGIGAVTFGFGLILPVLYLFGPPILLAVTWFVLCRR
jgi:hypothetical protein